MPESLDLLSGDQFKLTVLSLALNNSNWKPFDNLTARAFTSRSGAAQSGICQGHHIIL
jgi:hypothetical protein